MKQKDVARALSGNQFGLEPELLIQCFLGHTTPPVLLFFRASSASTGSQSTLSNHYPGLPRRREPEIFRNVAGRRVLDGWEGWSQLLPQKGPFCTSPGRSRRQITSRRVHFLPSLSELAGECSYRMSLLFHSRKTKASRKRDLKILNSLSLLLLCFTKSFPRT